MNMVSTGSYEIKKVSKIAISWYFMHKYPFLSASQYLTKYQQIAVINFPLQPIKEGNYANGFPDVP